MSTAWEPSAEQKKHYDECGYFVVKRVIDRDTAMEVRGVIKNHLLSPDAATIAGERDPMDPMGDTPAARVARFRKLGRLCVDAPLIWHAIHAGDVLPRIGQYFLGKDLLLKFNSCFLKPARTGSATPWHQDNGLWRDGETDPVNFWMAIDPATRANGCMQFMPGTHRLPIEVHGVYPDSIHGEIRRERVKECAERYGIHHIELEPGDAVVWHSNLYHYSPPNTSDHGRIAVAGVYTTPQLAARNAMHRKNYVVMTDGVINTAFPPATYSSSLEPTPMPGPPKFEEPVEIAAHAVPQERE